MPAAAEGLCRGGRARELLALLPASSLSSRAPLLSKSILQWVEGCEVRVRGGSTHPL